MGGSTLLVATAGVPPEEVQTKITSLRTTGADVVLEQLERLHVAKDKQQSKSV